MTEQYDFDQELDRRNTNSLKYDFGMERKGREDLIPLWVADMDFKLPDKIIKKLVKRAEHGCFGYTEPDELYYSMVASWFRKRHHWRIENKWITVTPSVVYAISQAISAFTGEGDAVIIQKPVYYPFEEAILLNRRSVVNNELVYQDGSYRIDFEDFEDKIIKYQVKLFLLCSPHNPVGRIWTKEELTKLGEICARHKVLVVADEIHGDFHYKEYVFTPFADIQTTFAENVIVCTSPSKTFNIAGLQIANIIIPNEELRSKYRIQISASGYSQPNTFGLVGCMAVYEMGEEWLDQLLEYLEENLIFAEQFLEENIPGIRLVKPQGTYLLWLDCRRLSYNKQELEELFVEKARLWPDAGEIFGTESWQFQRINIAVPRNILEQAFHQLQAAILS